MKITALQSFVRESGLDREVRSARKTQVQWAAVPLAERLRLLRSVRHRLAERAEEIVQSVTSRTGRPEAEVLSSEVIPLADACRFLEREAPRILAPRRLGSEGRPAWLGRVEVEVRREPLGLVLILAPANYPLFLPGVQALQALAAGNAVLWKPGRGGFAAARAFADLTVLAGLDWRLIQVLPDDEAAGRAAVAAGPDKVFLTGSAATGREVLAEAGRRLIPTVAELSGCDALFILPGASASHRERAAQAIRFGLTLNGGTTCIAPRRVFVPRALAPELEERLAELLPEVEVSLVPVAGMEEALEIASRCAYALGASVFGPEEEARALAGRVRAGVVTVNDVIVPTADPRVPFGGRGESGYGATRGAEGLLEMTAAKAVAVRRGRWLPHLEPRQPGDEELFKGWLAAAHGDGLGARVAGAVRLARAMAKRQNKGPKGLQGRQGQQDFS
jgi:acyl-CoA reductase-like NAD-dependent aldehyde dehydrogenase